MSAATIRLGKISSINYSAGKARVVYEDRDQSVTSELPFLAWQYHMPKNDLVGLLFKRNVAGVILDQSTERQHTTRGAGIFRQEMSNTKNEALSYWKRPGNPY